MAEADDDLSASTARFRAFAERGDEDLPAPWKMRVSRSKFALLGVIVLVFALIAGLLASLLAG